MVKIIPYHYKLDIIEVEHTFDLTKLETKKIDENFSRWKE